MRVLVVEDDPQLGDALATGLRQLQHVVDWFRDGARADAALQGVPYDAVVLDLGLPGGDGMRWLRQWRGVNETISSLLLGYIAIALFKHFVEGPMRDPASLNKPSTKPLPDTLLAMLESRLMRLEAVMRRVLRAAFASMRRVLSRRGCGEKCLPPLPGGDVQKAADFPGKTLASRVTWRPFLGVAARGSRRVSFAARASRRASVPARRLVVRAPRSSRACAAVRSAAHRIPRA